MAGFLASFWYFKGRDFTGWEPPLILDSGAFSAYTLGVEIDIEQYAQWVTRVKNEAPGFQWAVNLDVIGDSQGSYRQWLQLRDLGVDTVPVIHHGSPLDSTIQPYLQHGATRLAFGGMVGGGRKNLPWAAAALKYLEATAPHILTHGLGVVEGSLSSRMPWDTTDSSAVTAALRFATVRVIAPGTRGGFVQLALNSDRRPTRREAELVRSLGVDPALLRTSEGRLRNETSLRLAIRSTIREEALENRRRATARAAQGGDRPRDVTRYVVNGASGRFTDIIREELNAQHSGALAASLPTQGPGVLR